MIRAPGQGRRATPSARAVRGRNTSTATAGLPDQPPRGPASAEALTAPILVLGAPRSGTTWLAKIIDSHPDVLYRHEPDETIAAPSPLTPDSLPALLARWATETGARTVTKQPYFRKSWQPGWAIGVRTALAGTVSAASRMPPPFKGLGRLRIPDLAARP